MKRLFHACLAVLTCASLWGCNDGTDVDGGLQIAPDSVVEISKHGGSFTFMVSGVQQSKAVVQVSVSSGDPSRLAVDTALLTYIPNLSNAMSAVVHCVDNGISDGDHTITLNFVSVSSDSSFNQLTAQRTVVCKDEGGVDPGGQCQPGEIQCIDSGNFISCDAVSRKWIPTAVTCPSDRPVCDRQRNACAAPAGLDCTNGQIKCIDDAHYQVCNAATGTWDLNAVACPSATPVCNMERNACSVAGEECAASQIRCVDEGHYQMCDPMAHVWDEERIACPSATPVCNFGTNACGAAAAECSDGEKKCVDGAHYVVCDDTTHRWSPVQASCPSDKPVCNSGSNECEESQVSVCSVGQIQCVDNVNYRTCDPMSLTWSATTESCPEDVPVCNTTKNVCEKSAMPVTCKSGQILCVDDKNYKQCNVSKNNWTTTTVACPSETPVCNMEKNACEAAEQPPKPECKDKCSGDMIQRCSSSGELQAAESCGTGKVCRYSGESVSCVDQGDVSFTLSAQEISVYEGGRGTLTFRPLQEPTSSVVVTLTVSDPTEGRLGTTSYTFTKSNYNSAQSIDIYGLRDGEADGDQNYEIAIKVASSDPRYDGLAVNPIQVKTVDTEVNKSLYNGNSTVSFRAMAANITSGNNSSYNLGHGVRIFKAMKPDIVMIQEFNWYKESDSLENALKLVTEAFDSSYYVHRGSGSIPNGIISRYPIIDSGYWKSNKANNRNWEWAVIDLPGKKELLVISVHLHTSDNKSEAPSLMSALGKKIAEDKSKNLEYFLMIGGDFNSNFKDNGSLDDYFKVDVALPEDQDGDVQTNANRSKVLDHLFVDKTFDHYEVPVRIGSHTYPNGHVFDSRVYKKKNELGDVPPVKGDDSGATSMQHMAVIRDFSYSVD